MMRWNPAAGLLGLILFVVCGCAQPCFMTQDEYDRFHREMGLPKNLETNPAVGTPVIIAAETPSTVDSPEERPRYISLQECIAIALQQGTVGAQSIRSPGLSNDDLVSFSAGTGVTVGFFGSDAIRVLALQPAIDAANIERELARFDTQWTTSMAWNSTDEPVQGLSSFQNGAAACLIST